MGVVVRILLRVLAGFLLSRGMPADLTAVLYEPDIAIGVEAVVGVAIWGATEVYYRMAKKFG